MAYEEAKSAGMIEVISDDVLEAFLDAIQKQSINKDVVKEAGLKVVYTPLNGAGNKPVRAILERIGIQNVVVVPEQEKPDGTFPVSYTHLDVYKRQMTGFAMSATEMEYKGGYAESRTGRMEDGQIRYVKNELYYINPEEYGLSSNLPDNTHITVYFNENDDVVACINADEVLSLIHI